MNQILALGLACNAGMLGDQRLIAMSRYGDQSPESVELAARGNGTTGTLSRNVDMTVRRHSTNVIDKLVVLMPGQGLISVLCVSDRDAGRNDDRRAGWACRPRRQY
eukprot:COSAG06_NODE_4009_length_4665_cov_14.628673_7_plen_106_part_00